MDISQVKYNLNHKVRLELKRYYVDAEYILTGCMIRRKPTGEFFYQAELQDIQTKTVVISSLDDVTELRKDG